GCCCVPLYFSRCCVPAAYETSHPIIHPLSRLMMKSGRQKKSLPALRASLVVAVSASSSPNSYPRATAQ
ncbi:unnamed protein product, partial [Ectocarpus sp. 8 AP-2014]